MPYRFKLIPDSTLTYPHVIRTYSYSRIPTNLLFKKKFRSNSIILIAVLFNFTLLFPYYVAESTEIDRYLEWMTLENSSKVAWIWITSARWMVVGRMK